MATNGYTFPSTPERMALAWFDLIGALETLTVEDGSRILGFLIGGPVNPVDEFGPDQYVDVSLFVALVRTGGVGMTADELQAAHVEYNRLAGIDGEAAND